MPVLGRARLASGPCSPAHRRGCHLAHRPGLTGPAVQGDVRCCFSLEPAAPLALRMSLCACRLGARGDEELDV
jgi:hypothetical protein